MSEDSKEHGGAEEAKKPGQEGEKAPGDVDTCPVCKREFVWPKGQFTWNCQCGLVNQRDLVAADNARECANICDGTGMVPRITIHREKPVLKWGLLCPSCQQGAITSARAAGRKVYAISNELLPFYSEWQGSEGSLPYWRFICDLYDRLVNIHKMKVRLKGMLGGKRGEGT